MTTLPEALLAIASRHAAVVSVADPLCNPVPSADDTLSLLNRGGAPTFRRRGRHCPPPLFKLAEQSDSAQISNFERAAIVLASRSGNSDPSATFRCEDFVAEGAR